MRKLSPSLLNTRSWTACISPLESGYRLDLSAFKRLVEIQNMYNNGILVGGSTGEGSLLTNTEKMRLLKTLFSMDVSVPTMFNLPNNSIRNAVEWVKICNDMPVDALLISTPVYIKPGACGQSIWFEAVLDASRKPVMLYDIPSRTGVNLHLQALKNLQHHPNLWALKDSSGSTKNLKTYLEEGIADRIKIFCGDDGLLSQMAKEGGIAGLISVVSNVWPSIVAKYVEGCLNNEVEDDSVWQESVAAIFSTSNPVGVKALMNEVGLISSPCVRSPLSEYDLSSIDHLKRAHAAILQWEQKLK